MVLSPGCNVMNSGLDRRIAALLTCHNRRETTVECLRALRAQILPGWRPGATNNDERGTPNQKPRTKNEEQGTESPIRYKIEVFLVDDGCTDGTADAVKEVWPEATVIRGDGSLYWCGGMRVAWAEAAKSDPEYYLLLNDDTVIQPTALQDLLDIVGLPSESRIAVGAIVDPDSGRQIYGGIRYRETCPVPTSGVNIECHTMHANCALVSREVFKRVGPFLKYYTHAMGDWDYGNEARRHGCKVIQTCSVVGCCGKNHDTGTWRDRTLSRWERFKKLNSPKGLPFREWVIYCARNSKRKLWLCQIFSPYVRILLKR